MLSLNANNTIRARSDVEPIDPSLAPLIFSEVTSAQYSNVALLTALVYHIVITLDKEVKYFWSEPRSSVSLIYFANNLCGVLAAICNLVRQFFTWAGSFCNLLVIVLIDYILLIRVLALYSQDKRLSCCLKVLLGLEAAAGLAISIYGKIVEGVVVGRLAKGITICGSENAPPQTIDTISRILPMGYGLLLMCLALYKAAEYWKMSSGFKGFHLVRILIRDQVLYYGFIILCSVTRITDSKLSSISLLASILVGAAGSPTLLCILGGQLLINLKQAGERGANGGTNYTPKSVSNIEFA
ncbi:hypothetical protein ACEPAG_2581 [Sanghuangporus baumii]